MSSLQEYKCPCCGGAIKFDSSIQKMKCPYCDTEFEMETLQQYDEHLQNDKPEDFVIATGVQHSVREFATLAFHHAGIYIFTMLL